MAFDVEDERRFMRLESQLNDFVTRQEERSKREEEEKREAKKREEEEKREAKKKEEEEKREAKKREEEKQKAAKAKAKDKAKDDDDDDEDDDEEDEEARKARYSRSDREEAQRRSKAGEEDEDEETREARHAKDDEEEEAKRSVKMTSRAALNAEIVRLTMENASLRQNKSVVSIETRVETAIRRGIITKSQKRWALSNPRAFATLEAQIPKSGGQEYFEPGSGSPTTQTRGAKRTVADLNSTERHMCRQLGVTPEAYLKSLEEKPLGEKLVDANPEVPADKTAFSGK